MDKRSTVPIGLTPEARAVIEGIREDTGVAKQEAVSRILEWYAKQDRAVKRAILERDGDPVGELIRIRMGELAFTSAQREGIDALDEAQALRLMRQLIDHLDQITRAKATKKKGGGAEKKA